MYRIIRNIHLFAGLASLPFLLMYAISSIQMAHPKWFVNRPAVEQTSVRLQPALMDGRTVARLLMEQNVVHGEVRRIAPKADSIEIRVVRPGTVDVVQYSGSSGVASIRTERSGFLMMLNRLHHIAGMRHDYSVVNAWAAALLAAACCLLVLAATGIYLWFQTHTERAAGALLLTLNLVFSVVMMWILRTA